MYLKYVSTANFLTVKKNTCPLSDRNLEQTQLGHLPQPTGFLRTPFRNSWRCFWLNSTRCSRFPYTLHTHTNTHTFRSRHRDLLAVVSELLMHMVVGILLSFSGIADVITCEWSACLFVFHSTWRDLHFKVCTRYTYCCQCRIPSGLHCLRQSRVSGGGKTLTNSLNEIRPQVA